MLKTFFKLLLVTFAITSSLITKANYITASDLTYTCVGNYRYEFTMVVYAECSSPTINLKSEPSFTIAFSSDELGTLGYQELFKVAPSDGEEINLYCESEAGNLNCNGGNIRGLRKFTYKGTVDLSKYETASDWRVYWEQDGRSDQLTNIDSDKEIYYVESIINNKDVACNNSPKFGADAVFSAFTNEETEKDLLISDPDGDELRFKIISPRATQNTNVFYTGSASATSPFSDNSTISINNNGVLKYNLSAEDEVGLFDIEIEEWRDGKKINTTSRGIQISSFKSDNTAPVFIGFDGKADNFELSVCAGEELTTEQGSFSVYDPDGDEVSYSKHSIQDNSFSIKIMGRSPNRDTMYFSFSYPEIPSHYAGKNSIIFEAKDNACPVKKTTTVEFIINVNENPTVLLDLDKKIIPCAPPTSLEPVVTSESSDLDYKWYTWELIQDPTNPTELIKEFTLISSETESTMDITVGGQYAFQAIDDAGCPSTIVSLDELESDIDPIVEVIPFCFNSPTDFKNSSTSKLGDTFTNYDWSFGEDNQTSTQKTDSYTYKSLGSKTVIHSFETVNSNCKFSDTLEIDICIPPVPKFIQLDSCISNAAFMNTSTAFGIDTCSINDVSWEVDGITVENESGGILFSNELLIPFHHTINTPGNHTITMFLHHDGFCITEKSVDYFFYEKPEVMIAHNGMLHPDFYLNCISPDTLLKTEIINAAAGGLTYQWFHGVDSLTGQTNPTLQTDSLGDYTVRVNDVRGCFNDTSVSILYAPEAKLVYDTVCTFGNPVSFTDSSSTLTNRITDWEWNFDDGNTSIEQNPTHTFSESKIYNVTLAITDSVGCIAIDTVPVYNTFLESNFKFEPSIRSICAEDNITGYNVIPLGDTAIINQIIWNWGDEKLADTLTGDLSYDGDTITHLFSTHEDYTVKTEIEYNGHPGIHKNSCKISFEKVLNVQPSFKGQIFPFRYCIQDTAEFKFKRTGVNDTIAVVSYEWIVANNNRISTTDIRNPTVASEDIIVTSTDSILKHKFNEEINVSYHLRVTDVNGCVEGLLESEKIDKASTITEVAFDTVCLGEKTVLTARTENETLTTDAYIFESPHFENDSTPFTSSAEILKHEFTSTISGDVPLQIILLSTGYSPEQQEPKECRTVLDTSIYVAPIPAVKFVWDTVCSSDEAVQFTDLSTVPNNETIQTWLWDFGDGNTSTEQNPSHIFQKGGEYKVTLSVETENCPSAKTENVYVKHKPVASLIIDLEFPDLPEAMKPIPFTDQSEIAPNTDLVYQKYNFKDGTIEEKDDDYTYTLEHTFEEIDIYLVEYQIETNEGCRDTTIVRTDLNVYLEIPTVFTPNGDGNNDEVGLIQYNIKELYTFKIFNRWGQLVFDASDNLYKSWDGKFNGEDQEAGVYVVHIQALGAYDKSFNLKTNLTLIR